MTRAEALAKGRESFEKQAWGTAFSHLAAANQESQLDPQDLNRLAIAAHLTGRETESADVLARAHQAFLGVGDAPSAARCALWLALSLQFNGELAKAGGWLARARRVLESGHDDCVEQGYLLLPDAIRSISEGNTEAGYNGFVRAAATGTRFGDQDLVTLALMGQGHALLRMGDTTRGVSRLDEAMVAVTNGEVSPAVAGKVYCGVIEACNEIFDLRRAQEWTSALDRWCQSQPDLVPYRGHCQIRRAEILQLHGAWPDAFNQARQAREQLSQPPPSPAVGAAIYRIAELHRLRGEFVEAEEAYRQANRWERTPQPGFAQLRLAQGQIDAAYAAVRHVVDGTHNSSRARALDAYVEIALAAGDVSGARKASDELAQIAQRLPSPVLNAWSAAAVGSILLAEQLPREALFELRRALDIWRDLEAPYEAARVRVRIALACREQGDCDTAGMELDSASRTFRQLEAAPDLARIEALSQKSDGSPSGPLTAREVEVLVLIASGKTNRGIAGDLGISEKTVARHVSNIFTKLDLPSRAAATAYAYRQKLV